MAGRFLLDTNIVIAPLKPDPGVVERSRAEQLYVSATVLGELYFGAAKGARAVSNESRIDRFAKGCDVLPCDQQTSRVFGQIKVRLEALGRRIPENDIWIAASAMQHGLTLVSRDAHFDAVEGLSLVSW
jgi:tRNA(fMet)-specific endonuclease VapC